MRRFGVVLLVGLLLTGSVFAQLIEGPFQPTSFDGRARAMGHTEIMSATGSNAIFYNPANLGMVT